MTRSLVCRLVGILLLLLLPSPAAWAQATAELSGRVIDESGGVLPGVTVTVMQTDTGLSRSVVTDGNGNYVIPNLPTGPYRLEAMLQGFRTYVQMGLVLQVAATPTINVVMSLGSLEETVTIEAAAPLVDVRSAGLSEVVEQERILELPLQGRQVTDLIVLAGAAVQTVPNIKSMPGSVFTAVAGGLPFGVAYLLDAAPHNNPYDNLNMPLPFPDALQEFRVATSALSADNGVHAGGTVNAVTKSGTNVFHGNLFEFVRDKRFNATAVFAPIGPDGTRRDDGLKRHQPGGTLGGPIVNDRLFFFGAFQGTYVRATPPDILTQVPTAAMLAGDFSGFASPACNRGQQVTLRTPFVNNRIDPALFSPAATNIVRRLPTTTDPCGFIRYSSPYQYDQSQVVARMDYQAGADHSVFGRYIGTFDKKPAAYGQSDNVLTTLRPDDNNQWHRAHSLTLGDTWVLGSSAVNTFRVAWNRTNSHYNQVPTFGAEDVGVKNFYNYVPGVIVFSITGGFSGSPGSVYFQADTDAYQVSDLLTLVRGSHQMSFGADVSFWKHDTVDGGKGPGQWTFNGQFTGLGMADFMTGKLFRLEHARPGVLSINQTYMGLYTQDTWRVNSRVTLNAGLRWEPFLGQNVRNNAVSNFSLDNWRRGVRTTVYQNAPPGLLYPGDPGFPSGSSGLNKKWGNLAPRVGMAWDVAGDGRTALRSSYGLGYDFHSASYLFISATAAPFSNRLFVNQPAGGFDDPYRDWPGGPPHPVPAVPSPDAPFPAYGSYGAIDPDVNSPRVQSWNVILERQIGNVWQASASYLGSYTDRIWGQVQLNPGVYLGSGPCTLAGVFYPSCTTAANLNQRRALSLENPATSRLLGSIDLHAAVGTQDYHAVRLSVQRRAATGLRLSANYTRSYCEGNSVQTTFGQFSAGYLKPDDPEFDRGNCFQDRRHIGNVTVGAQTPEFANAALRALASDWTVAGILSARSGSFLTVTTGRDIAGTGIGVQAFSPTTADSATGFQQNQRPNQVLDDPYGNKSLDNYLNRTAFAYPDAGELGNHTRGSVVGPAFWTVDLALSRSIRLAAAQTLELRVETFNLLNHFNRGNPNLNLDAGDFGRILTQAGTPRIMQFGIKYGF